MKYVLLVAMAVFLSLPSAIKAEELSKSDQIRSAVQDICPVSGKKLGTHGQPAKVKIGEEVVFLCCKGCLNGKVKAEHWSTIHANFAKAQGICPVMKKPLPRNPKWTVVDGRIVYVHPGPEFHPSEELLFALCDRDYRTMRLAIQTALPRDVAQRP